VIGAGRPDGYQGTMIPEIWRGHQRGGEGFLIAIQRLSEAYVKAMDEVWKPEIRQAA
jgi:hypothetical protein